MRPQPLQPPPGMSTGPRGAPAAATGARGGSGSRHGAVQGRVVEMHGGEKKGSAGHPLRQALPGFPAGWCSLRSALLPTPQNARVEKGTPHLGEFRGERERPRPLLSPRARRQATVPDSGSGKQLAQRGGDGGDTTLTRTEHGWPKATLEAELGCLAEPRLAHTLHTTVSRRGEWGICGDPTAPHVTQALPGIGISL